MTWASYILVAFLVINILSSAFEAGKASEPKKFFIPLICAVINVVLYYFAGVFG